MLANSMKTERYSMKYLREHSSLIVNVEDVEREE
jgi:hypothetical protein